MGGYLKAVWTDFWGAFLRSGRPRGLGKAFQKIGGFAPHICEGFSGPPGPARLQKCTKTTPARLPPGTQPSREAPTFETSAEASAAVFQLRSRAGLDVGVSDAAEVPTRFGTMDVAKPCRFIGFGAMDVTKPCRFIGFGAMDVTKPYARAPFAF